MIYTVTFNPALDYIIQVDNLAEGYVNRVSNEKIVAGGKGINVSLVLKNLGADSVALGFIAGFTGDEIQYRLKKEGCRTDFIKVKEGMSRINVKIKANAETEINGIGPHIIKEDVDKLFGKLDKMSEGDILVLAGSIPDSLSQTIYGDIMKELEGKGVLTVVDATGQLLMNVLKYRPFLVKPNHHELAQMFETTISTKDDIIKYALKLKEAGAANVLVSMAGDGALLIDEYGHIHEQSAPAGHVVNSVGAGDSMIAGFLTGYLRNGNYEHALKLGVSAGSASAFSDKLATKELVEKIYGTI